MHIWIVNHYAVPATAYGGTRHFSLARELVARGHQAAIVAGDFHHNAGEKITSVGSASDDISSQRVRFHWVSVPAYAGNGLARLRNMLTFAWRVCQEDLQAELGAPDVIIGSSPHPFAALAAQLVARRLRVPFVLEVRDLWPDSLVKVAGLGRKHPLVLLLGLLERYLYRRANAIVSLLPNARDHIIARGGHPDGVFWIPNGVDFGLAPAPMEKPPGDSFVVVYAGTHGHANALESLLDAAELLTDEAAPRIAFRFIGDGPEKSRLKLAAERRGMKHVHFDDAVPKEQVYGVLQRADVLVATTRNIDLYAHGLSFNKLFDYLAAGRPIVFGAASPGNPVEQARAGIVVPPEDSHAIAEAIRELARLSPAERQAIGDRGRRYAEEHYDMRTLANRLEVALAFAVQEPRADLPPRS